jgi:putative ABC transport system permease protein
MKNLAYKITVGWEMFLGAAVIALIIAILTISYQSIGAELVQALKSLRTK